MPRSRLLFLGILTSVLFTLTAQAAFVIIVRLSSASVPFSSKYPEHAQKLVRAALKTEGCKFIDGFTSVQSSTIHFAGDTQSINELLKSLASCPGVTVTVSFATIENECDWRIVHDTKSNTFCVVLNLSSDLIKLDELAIPPVVGPELVP